MSDNRPYQENDAQWNELPLPEVNASWQKMNELLDKEKKRRIIPFFLTLTGISLIIAFCIGVAWLAFRAGGKENELTTAKNSTVTNQPSRNFTSTRAKTKNTEPKSSTENNIADDASGKNETSGKATMNQVQQSKRTSSEVSSPAQSKIVIIKGQDSYSSATEKKIFNKRVATNSEQKQNDAIAGNIPGKPVRENHPSDKQAADKESSISNGRITDTMAITANVAPQKSSADSTIKIAPAIVKENTDPKRAHDKKSPFYFSAGFGVQQQLRSSEQVVYSQSYYGKKELFSEHIPSVYFRFYKKQTWFVQAEFRFGAPQLVKDYSYAKQVEYSRQDSTLRTTTSSLRKLYYHQLPISFNYYVAPHLSVGAGGIYSIFYRAVTEENINSKSITSGIESSSKNIRRQGSYNDSFFFKSQVQAMIQADYQWRNWSAGLRYKKDLQPYIRYMKPDGTIEEEMNNALEIIIRYQLWKQKKSER
jgi:hypothetical protein